MSDTTGSFKWTEGNYRFTGRFIGMYDNEWEEVKNVRVTFREGRLWRDGNPQPYLMTDFEIYSTPIKDGPTGTG